MQKYEMMVLYKPLLLEDIKKNTISVISKLVESKKGSFTEVDNLGKRILAYPINKFQEGHYVQYDLEMNPSDLSELKREMSIMENILRFLIIKKK